MLKQSIQDLVRLLRLFPVHYRSVKWGVALGFIGGVLVVCGYASVVQGFALLAESELAKTGAYPFRLLVWLAAGLVCLLAGYYCSGKALNVTHAAVFHLEVNLRDALTEKIATIPVGEVLSQGTGKLKKVIFDDVKALHAAIADASPFVGMVFGRPLAALVILLLVQWKLFIVVCLVLLAVRFSMKLMMRDFIPQEQRYSLAQENCNQAVIEFVQGMPVVRTFDSNQVAWRRYSSRIQEFSDAVIDWMRTTRFGSQLNEVFTNVIICFMVVTLISVVLLVVGAITLPQMMMGLVLGMLPVQAFKPFNIMVHLLFYSRAGARRILELFATPDAREPRQSQFPQRSDVRFNEVSFAYKDDRQILQNISFHLQQGQTCALVGASGCGKSTITRLLARFYDSYSGEISIGGVNIREISSADLLRKIAFIFQDPFLTTDSIAENIRLYQPNASMEMVEQAARVVNLHDFISALPQGYHTSAGEKGSRLSGGQRQRITIARALLSEAQIIVLDEATASVDPENEAEIVQSLAKLTADKTVMTIAHRLATISHCDQIIALDKGRITGVGSHEQLLQSCPHYASLWENYRRASNWTISHEV